MTAQARRTEVGKLLYQRYLLSNCISLTQGRRNRGILGEICERLREGTQTDDDLSKLTFQRRKCPSTITDYGIHYDNDTSSSYNWRCLSSECQSTSPPRRLYVCKAVYYTDGTNQLIVDALAALPAKTYNYAPDILCLTERCEVRLVENLHVSAGLVNSVSGTVIKIIYDNADVSALLAGQYPPPYCVIVDFPEFRGFKVDGGSATNRIFHFRNHPTWVPIYRKKFDPKWRELPTWISKKQQMKNCYRQQFPLDVYKHITAHRAQGQTMVNCLISVDLNLDNPDAKLPSDVSSVMYVALTRAEELKNLFVSPVFPTIWQTLGQSDHDKQRRVVENKLRQAAKNFAAKHGKYSEVVNDLSWTSDYSKNTQEWCQLQHQDSSPSSKHASGPLNQPSSNDEQLDVCYSNTCFSMIFKPVLCERHIGIDQGVKNFATAVVDKPINGLPKIVAADNFTDLQLGDNFEISDVILALSQKKDFLSWLDPSHLPSGADRVVVHLEQIHPRNRHWKQFSINFGKQLQQLVPDPKKCIVKLSQPHIHRAGGPMFHLGSRIVETLDLLPVANSSTSRHSNQQQPVQPNPTEAIDRTDGCEQSSEPTVSLEYGRKKKMSADIFNYIIHANEDQLKDMHLEVNTNLQTLWRQKVAETNGKLKLDDVGDALLHALNEILCGSTNYKQLIPSTLSLHNNRTIAITQLPFQTFWIVLQCTWNVITFENFGTYKSRLQHKTYKSNLTADFIRENMDTELKSALVNFEETDIHSKVDNIKVIIKQLSLSRKKTNFRRIQAGALTDCTVRAVKRICDQVMGRSSQLCERRDKNLGYIYLRINRLKQKFQVTRSAGKHTNAILSLLEFMKVHIPSFVEKRTRHLTNMEKIVFFDALQKSVEANISRIDTLQLTDTVKQKFLQYQKPYMKSNIADLLLIAMNKNQSHVKAISSNRSKTLFARGNDT